MSIKQNDGVLDNLFNSSQNNPQNHIEPDTELPSSHSTRETHRPAQKETCILILGPTGSGKSSLINLVTGGNLSVGSPGSGPCTTECRYAKKVIEDRTFRLIDSPGWDTNSRHNVNQFKHLVEYLLKIRAIMPTRITGALCLYPQGSNLECDQLRRILGAIQQLLGETWLPHITIAIVGNSPSTNSDAVQSLQTPASPFHSFYTGGSKFRQLALQPRAIEEILLEFNAAPPEEPDFYSKVTVRWRGRPAKPYADRDGLNKLIEPLFRQQTDSDSRTSRRPPRPTLEESENARQQLQVALDSSEAELKLLRAQLEQTRLEYGSLRTELQLHDNTEQTKVVQSLKDLTRMIEDCSRAVAQHLVDNYVTPDLNASNNPDEVTALNAVNLVDLRAQFGLNDGGPSLIATSTGIGMPIEDFFDMALRSILCRRLYQDIFLPFHPMVGSTSDAAFMKFLYEGIRHHAPQSVAAKWRANSFIALTKGKGTEARNEMIEAQSHRIMADDISSLINSFFGHEKAIVLHERHLENIKQVINSAWEWNDVLKGDIIMLGDFQPTYYESGQSFQPQYMVEFEGKRGGPPAEVVLCTIGLGLSLSHPKTQAENSGPVVIYKAKVVTECFYDR